MSLGRFTSAGLRAEYDTMVLHDEKPIRRVKMIKFLSIGYFY
jgi:hypothetical protein